MLISIFISEKLGKNSSCKSEEKVSSTKYDCSESKIGEIDPKRNIQSNDQPKPKDKSDVQTQDQETEV